MAAASAGIPHPPGAPTYVALLTAFVKLGGFQDVARGTNLFSGLAGAATLAILSILTQIWVARAFPHAPVFISTLAGIVAPLVLLHSPAFLEISMTTEQYTLMTALIALILLLSTVLVDSEERPFKTRAWLGFLLGWLWGLAIGNHLSQVVLGLLVGWAVWSGTRRGAGGTTFLKLAAITFGGLGVGLLIFLWLPLRSRANPLIDWGNPESWDRFLWVLTRQQWSYRPLSEAPAGFVREWLKSYDLLGQLGMAGFGLTILGLFVLMKRNMRGLGWLAAVAIPYAVGMMVAHMRQEPIDLSYIRYYGVTDWHLPIYLVAALSAGVATGWLLIRLWLGGRRPLSYGVALAMIAWLLGSAALSVQQASLRNFESPQRYIQQLLAPLPADAIIVVSADNLMYMLGYHRYVQGANPNQWVGWGLIALPVAMARAIQSEGGWNRHRRTEYLTEILVDPDEHPLRIAPLTEQQVWKRRLFTEFTYQYPETARYLLPRGFLFEVFDRPTTDEEVIQAEAEWQQQFASTLWEPAPPLHLREREAWAHLYWMRGWFFLARGMWQKAAEALTYSLRWIDNEAYTWFCLGYAQQRLGQFQKAAQSYENALQLDPNLRGPRVNLAKLYLQIGELESAEQLLMQEVELYPDSQEAHKNLRALQKLKARLSGMER